MASSTGCANSGFRKAADDGKKEFRTNAADLMRRHFYVDDGFKSVQDASTVVDQFYSEDSRRVQGLA